MNINMQTEPSVIIGSVGAVIVAAIPLLAKALGWTDEIAAEWETLLLAIWTVVGMLVTAFVIRQRVVSPATHEAEVEEALQTEPPK